MPAIRGDDNASSGQTKKKPLARNSACLTCRQRKVKCDAEKPACGPCVKTALLHGEDPRAIKCDYDSSLTKGSAGTPLVGSRFKTNSNNTSKGKSKVGELEDKVAQLEALIRNGNVPQQQATSSVPTSQQVYNDNQNLLSRASTTSTSDSSTSSFSPWLSSEQDFTGLVSSSQNVMPSITESLDPAFGGGLPTASFDTSPSATFDGATAPLFNGSSVIGNAPSTFPNTDAFFQDLVYPGWPSDLPSPKLTRKLLDLYFSKPHCASFLLNRSRFEADFALPPSSAKFPSSALLHALLSVAYTVSAPNVFGSDSELYWQDGDSTSPAVYHGRRGKFWIDYHIEKGTKLLHLAQSVVLLCFFSWSHARFQEVWLYSGMATRICCPLGLNHMEAFLMDHNVTQSAPHTSKGHLCPGTVGRAGAKCLAPPATTEEERYERASLMWHAFVCDRIAQANTGWASSLDEADITTLLPSLNAQGPISDDPFQHGESLSTDSSSFFISHPSNVVGPFQLYIKSTILLSRVMSFIQRAPWPIGSRAQLRAFGKQVATSPSELRESPSFKDLDSDIVAFRLSFHRDLKTLFSKFENTPEDHHLLLAQAVAHVATMFLHQPFSTRQPNDPSFARCLTSARAIVTTIHMLMFSRFDVGLLHPFMMFTWSSAGRILVHDMAIHLHYGNEEPLKRNRSEVGMLILAMDSMKTPLAEHTRFQLRAMADDPTPFLLPEMLDLPASLRKGQGNASSTEGPSLSRITSDNSDGPSSRLSPASTYSSSRSPPQSDGRSTGASNSSTSPFTNMSDVDILGSMGTGSSAEPFFPTNLNDFIHPMSTSSHQSPNDINFDPPSKEPEFVTTPFLDFMGLGSQHDYTSMPMFEDTVVYG